MIKAIKLHSRYSLVLLLLFPITCFSQFNITGRVLNQADNKPVADASVFLSNATIGSTTTGNGTFTLTNVKPGRYDLVVSIIGFETYNQTLTVGKDNIRLADIIMHPKAVALTQVTIKYHADPDREKYLGWFKDEFLGTSTLASACRIINPEVLDLNYDGDTNTLTASSYDFLIIDNDALGYRIKYMVTDFSLQTKNGSEKSVFYKGPVLFEPLKGSASKQKRWLKNRQQVYENSPMHFLRAALSNRITEEGFRVQKEITYGNPARPSDSLVDAKIKFYKKAKLSNTYLNDPEGEWIKIAKLPKTIQKTITLSKKDLIRPTDQPGMYALMGDTNKLFVAYSKSHRYHIKNNSKYLDNANNNENTLIKFNAPEAFFYSSGVITNPYSLQYFGVWGRGRVAELLPVNYEPPQGEITVDEIAADNIRTKVDSFMVHHPTEKAYLHFDKPYYAAGDTMYFKAYVTVGEQRLSDLSGVLHVQLMNAKGKVDQSVKLKLTGGLAWGDFALPDSLPSGKYRVVAYTQWMRNDSNYFEKVMPVGSVQPEKIPESEDSRNKHLQGKADFQFFPEGGQLVAGISSRVAFKAVGTDGLGLDVNGVITDDSGAEVCRFSSAHRGMGSFYIHPVPGKTYKARLSFSDGSTNAIDLPLANSKGITLSVNNDSIPKATVKIQANATYFNENKGKAYTVVIYSGGVATPVGITLDSAVVKLDVLKRHLHTGIATITLFSASNEPLAERLIFIQNYDQLNLQVSGDKTSYPKRGKATLTFKAINRRSEPATGHFSVSVVDESKVPDDENSENTILTDLLLTSDLKGNIEDPNYYFSNISEKTLADLDLVTLTHGYRRFEWKKLLNNEYPPIAFEPEKGLEIAGSVNSLSGKPLANGTVTLIPGKADTILSTASDDKGNFRFSNLAFPDSTHFILSAVNAKGKNSTKITYLADKPLFAPVPNLRQAGYITGSAINTYLAAARQQRDELIKYGTIKGTMLKQVNIRQKKPDDQYRTESLAGAGHADQVMHADEIGYMDGSLAQSLNGRLRGVTFSNPQRPGGGIPFLSGSNAPMLVILDGTPLLSGASLNDLMSHSVETVEVLRFASASIYGMRGGAGVLVITTKRGGRDLKDITSVGILPIITKGFYKAREFYSPKYESPQSVKRPDLRSTIYWKPELQTGKDGAAAFEYYNADGAGKYRVTIEGIDEQGNIGRQVYRYSVE